MLNVIDSIIAMVNPEKAMRRMAARKVMTVLNSGYSEGGASTRKKSMRGWQANSASPDEDINGNLYMLRNRSRDLFMNAPLATSAIKTTRTNVIGAGLRLKAQIDYQYLGMTEEAAEEWEQTVQREFSLWAESKHCDALKMNDFYEQQQLAQLCWLQSGDVFALFKNEIVPYTPYSLRLHLIEGDRVNTPNQPVDFYGGSAYLGVVSPKNDNQIISGVEIDKAGAVVAYWVSNRYPQSLQLTTQNAQLKWERIEAYGAKTGRPNILHLMEAERAEQRRGAPFLAPVIEALKQMTRYTEAELTAAVISSMFTVFIKSEGPSSNMPLGEMIPDSQKVALNDEAPVYEMGPGAVNVLQPGEDIQFANPGRPNQAFEGFINAFARYIGAALEIPQELLQKSFQSSYSASRAALLEAWKMFRMRRAWMANRFCQPVYEEWLSEAVAIGRIKAPGFFIDPAIRKAWCGAEWNGPSPGQLDPVKEANASVIKIENGFSTRERETIELTGGDFVSNTRQLRRENKLMKEVNGENGKVNPQNAGS